MRNFQDTFETRKRSFVSAFSICMTIPVKYAIFFESYMVLIRLKIKKQPLTTKSGQ